MSFLKKFVSTLAMAALLVASLPMTAFAVQGSTQDPDLLITSITLESTLIGFTAANQGLSDVPGANTVDLEGQMDIYVNNVLTRTYDWSQMAFGDTEFLIAGDETTIYPGFANSNTALIRVCIDSTDEIMEADESNNCYEVDFVASQPVDDGTYTDVDGNDGSVEVTTTVISNDVLDGLGDDDDDEVTIDIVPTYADLLISDLYLDEGNVLSVRLENGGVADVEEDLGGVLEIYIDDMDDPVWTYNWDDLEQKEFLSAGDWSVVQPQTIEYATVKACVDTTDVVTESDETNNCTDEVTLGEMPVETALYVDVAGVESDDDTSFYAKVCNASTSDVSDLEIIFLANDYENALSYAGTILSEDCMTLYSWGFSSFGVEDGDDYELTVTVEGGGMTDIYTSEVAIPEDEVTDILEVEAVEILVSDDDVADEVTDEVSSDLLTAEVEIEFGELWTDTTYPDTYYLDVAWGYYGDETEMDPTDWDGSVNFEGSIVGKPTHVNRFEPSEDWIDYAETNPTQTSFQSMIHNAKDGILFKLKADLDNGDPFVEFNSEYENTSWEVDLEDLVDAEGGVYEYDYGNGYKVVLTLMNHEDWANKFKSTILLQVRVGNLDGEGSSGDEDHVYSVRLTTSDASVIPSYMPVLLEDHQGDFSGYDQLTRNAGKNEMTLEAGIFGHQDGFMALLNLVDATAERYVKLEVVDNDTGAAVFAQTFTQDVELGVFELDDGTGNKVSIKNMFRYKSHLIENAEAVFAALYSWQAQVYRFVAVVEALSDTGALSDEVEAMMIELTEELMEVVPSEDAGTVLGDVHQDLGMITAFLYKKLNSHGEGSITDDELNNYVATILNRANTTIEEGVDEVNSASGLKTDVDYDAWYGKYMDMAVLRGFFGGYKNANGTPNGLMGPADNITRFQLIKVISELANELEMGDTASCDADSVDLTSTTDWMEDHWARGYVQCIENSGMDLTLLNEVIMKDVSVGTSPAQRWEVVALAFEMLGANSGEYSDYTQDDLAGSSLAEDYKAQIQTAVDLGILSGYPDGNFRPMWNVNRAEMFKIVTLFYDVFSQQD